MLSSLDSNPSCFVVSPFHGSHWYICREDGTVLDFAGSNFVNVADFAFGSIQLDRERCCFPTNLSTHTCKHGYKHAENGTALTWDDALHSSTRHFENKTYNLFTCNCHSFVANCLNRLSYGGSIGWNMINVAILIQLKGHWVDKMSTIRSYLPFISLICLGIYVVGWPLLTGLLFFSSLPIRWFLVGTYCMGC